MDLEQNAAVIDGNNEEVVEVVSQVVSQAGSQGGSQGDEDDDDVDFQLMPSATVVTKANTVRFGLRLRARACARVTSAPACICARSDRPPSLVHATQTILKPMAGNDRCPRA